MRPSDDTRHLLIAAGADYEYPMLKDHQNLPRAKTPHEQESLLRRIAATDSQIDALVYELHRPGEEEIRVVEGEETC